MKKLTYALLLLLSPALFSQPTGQSGGWSLIFEDNFNGSSLDLSKWSYNYPWGNGHTHNHEAWCVAEQVTVQNGYLRITATDQKHPESTSGYDYTSGIITTYNKFHMDEGFIEGRFKMPATLGTWPAFWTLGAGWPPEIDILEVPHERNVHHYYMHYTNPSGGESSFGGTHSGPDKSAGYHIYGVEWGPSYMNFYFDGQRIASYNRPEPAQAVWQYILINLAVGGWAGAPPAGAQFPCYYDCDWVRAWERDDSPLDNGVYRISPSHAPNQAVEVYNFGTSNGTNICQWSYWGGNFQRWDLQYNGDGYYYIRSVGAPGQSMDVDSWSTANGANVMTWSFAGGTNQQFQLVPSGSGFQIRPRHSNKCLDIASQSTSNGANVNQWDCWGGANQTFLFTRLSSAQENEEVNVETNVAVYPNPLRGNIITVKAMLNASSDVNVSVFNIQGQHIYHEYLGKHNSGELVHNIEIENIEKGMYIVSLDFDGKNEKTMFVKQ